MQATKTGIALPGVPYPFPGLRSFGSEEEPIFRGRQQHTDELLRRLAAHRFLAVVGTSGSGKSSLVRAGLRPALDRGYLAGTTSHWRVAIMRPGLAPIKNLVEALNGVGALGTAEETKLRLSSLGLVETVRDARLVVGESLLLVADQFEELFRYQRRIGGIDSAADAALFVSLLLTAAARPDVSIYVVLTMRSDFLGDCAQFPGLSEALSESQYLIPRLSREQRRQAIEEPLRLFGAPVASKLVEQLLNDSGGESSASFANAADRGGAPDPLPILQHALMRSYLEWTSRPLHESGRSMDLLDYRKAGGMESALDQHAEHIFNQELNDPGRQWAERIFRCLTTTELGRPVRRPTPLIDLYKITVGCHDNHSGIDEVLAVLQRGENSLLKIQSDNTVDISHESLIWKWKRLSRWVTLEAVSAELYRDLLKEAASKGTWGEPKLSSALAIRKQDDWNENWARQYAGGRFEDVQIFLSRSRQAVRNQRLLGWFAAVAADALLILGVVAYYSGREVVQDSRELETLKLVQALQLKTLAADFQSRQKVLTERIKALDSKQGTTKEERDHIAKERSALEAQLVRSKENTQQLTTQTQQSTDLMTSVKSLGYQLDQAKRDRDTSVSSLESQTQSNSQLLTQVDELQTRISGLQRKLDEAKSVSASSGIPAITQNPLHVLSGHQGVVMSVSWRLDAKLLASASADKTLRIWQADNGQLLRVLSGHQGTVNSVAWSPDGTMLASGSADKTIRLWEADTGRPLRLLSGHQGIVFSIAWSPDGKMLASAGQDHTVQLWEVESGRRVQTLLVGQRRNEVLGVAWSPDGNMLASASSDHAICLWTTVGGKLLMVLSGHQDKANSVAWSPDGKTLASASNDRTVRLWEVASGRTLMTLRDVDKVNSVTWSPDGRTLASSDIDGSIRLWEAATGKALNAIQSGEQVNSVAWSSDGKIVASAGQDFNIDLWSPDSQTHP